jgi:alpha-galactosidase/6-phospho-beta-glucosidase family protein
LKICLIGAGSAVFWLTWVRDLGVMKSAPGSTFSLVDINKERLDSVYGLATRYTNELGVDIKFEKGDDRRKALVGADYVINTAFPGSHDYTENMRAIGEKHGYYRGIDAVDFNFVSDYYTILGYKQYQLALDIASDMEEICPNAWLLQVANPIFEVTTLLLRDRPKIKTIGFCDEFVGIYHLFAALGLSPADVDFQVAGFNHCIWLTRFKDKNTGENLYPMIDKWIKNESEEFWKNHDLGLWDETLSPASVDMYKMYGLYPIGDTTRSFTWKYHYNLETAKRWFGYLGGTDSELGLRVRLDRFQQNAEKLTKLASDPSIKLTSEIPPFKGQDQFSDFIDAAETGEETKLVLNIPNNGIYSQFPNDVSVEIPTIVSKGGKLSPEKPPLFPKRLLYFVLIPRMLHMEWGLEAFRSGSREILVENLIRDPRTRSEKQARDAVEAILSMPENKDMAKHYR